MEPSENLFCFEQIEAIPKIDSIQVFEEIRKEIDEHLLEQSEDTDSADCVFKGYFDSLVFISTVLFTSIISFFHYKNSPLTFFQTSMKKTAACCRSNIFTFSLYIFMMELVSGCFMY